MGLLCDWQIRALAEGGMITPFHEGDAPEGWPSHGLCSAGYDIRLGEEFKWFDRHASGALRPGANRPECYYPSRLAVGEELILPPLTGVLGCSVETFSMPRDVLAIAVGKSTYARLGLFVNITPLECGWKGQLTIELFNSNSLPVAVRVGGGIAQLLFLRTEGRPERAYADRGGLYQGQAGVTPARTRGAS